MMVPVGEPSKSIVAERLPLVSVPPAFDSIDAPMVIVVVNSISVVYTRKLKGDTVSGGRIVISALSPHNISGICSQASPRRVPGLSILD
mmetsp:Transcript_14424/g.12926  ORF Transcript_14424/g.12926 Transcript_14424/m.12926 type:complete len:89 (-) Transcript_14424:513-779(-)